jgi:CRP-like cAMP-binding protein
MTTIAEFSITADGFPFGNVFIDSPGTSVEIERLKNDSSSLAVYFWLSGDLVSLSSLESHEVFESVQLLDSVGDEQLFVARWASCAESVLKIVCETGLTLDSAELPEFGEWTFKVRAESAELLSRFQQRSLESGFRVRFTRFPTLTQVFDGREYNLTEKQHSTLVLAYTMGYFEEPRQATHSDIADQLGITAEAVLARLRKGERNLLENTIVRSTDKGM